MSNKESSYGKRADEKHRTDAISLLNKQLEVEQKLLDLYEETEKDVKSSAVKHLLHMIQLDSKKHIDICQFAKELLSGEDVFKEEKAEIIKGLNQHIELETESITASNDLLENVWIQEVEGLKSLVKMWRDDEKQHHKALSQLANEKFFRTDFRDFSSPLLFSTPEDLENRYKKLFKKIYFGK